MVYLLSPLRGSWVSTISVANENIIQDKSTNFTTVAIEIVNSLHICFVYSNQSGVYVLIVNCIHVPWPRESCWQLYVRNIDCSRPIWTRLCELVRWNITQQNPYPDHPDVWFCDKQYTYLVPHFLSTRRFPQPPNYPFSHPVLPIFKSVCIKLPYHPSSMSVSRNDTKI